jgi:hypothetical protein
MATAVFAETVEYLQHSAQHIPENPVLYIEHKQDVCGQELRQEL